MYVPQESRYLIVYMVIDLSDRIRISKFASTVEHIPHVVHAKPLRKPTYHFSTSPTRLIPQEYRTRVYASLGCPRLREILSYPMPTTSMRVHISISSHLLIYQKIRRPRLGITRTDAFLYVHILDRPSSSCASSAATLQGIVEGCNWG